MDGGDMRISREGTGGLGLATAPTYDASSVCTGEFTEERTVAGTRVFLTPDGASLYDAMKDDGYTFVALSDRKPEGFLGKLTMIIDGLFGQQHGPRSGPEGSR